MHFNAQVVVTTIVNTIRPATNGTCMLNTVGMAADNGRVFELHELHEWACKNTTEAHERSRAAKHTAKRLAQTG